MTRRWFLERAAPAAAIAAGLPGCAAPISVGQQRRRSLFHALLWSWMLGLALAWRWWGRPRRPPG